MGRPGRTASSNQSIVTKCSTHCRNTTLAPSPLIARAGSGKWTRKQYKPYSSLITAIYYQQTSERERPERISATMLTEISRKVKPQRQFPQAVILNNKKPKHLGKKRRLSSLLILRHKQICRYGQTLNHQARERPKLQKSRLMPRSRSFSATSTAQVHDELNSLSTFRPRAKRCELGVVYEVEQVVERLFS